MNIKFHPWSLRWIIGGTYFFIITVTLGLLALYLINWTQNNSHEYMRRSLRMQLQLSSDMVSRLLRTRSDARSIVSRIIVRGDARQVTLLTRDGYIIAETPMNASQTILLNTRPLEMHVALKQGIGEDKRINPQTNEMTLYVARYIRLSAADENGNVGMPMTMPAHPTMGEHPAQPEKKRIVKEAVLILAEPLTEIQESTNEVQKAIIAAYLMSLVVFLLINFSVSTFMVNPLVALSNIAQRFANGDLKERINLSGAWEISSLGKSFNTMAEQLRETITKLAEEHAQAQAFLSSMADGLLVTDALGNIVLMNKPAEEICDLQYHHALGQPLNTAIENYEINELLRKTLTTKNNSQGEIVIKYPTLRHIQIHIAPVEVEGNTFGAVITLYDITQIRKIESTQRDFVANVSHELRTPVTSIRAMLETLLDGGKDDPEMTEDFLKTLVGESERLTKLLDDLLHLARLESGHKRLNISRVDLITTLNETINRIQIAIKAKKQKIITNLPLKLEINADSDVMMQIFLNLLDNARKYSPEGATITISAEIDENIVTVKIMDTGYGIPAEDLDRIFERFYRVNKARTSLEGGTGLGLAIVKNLIEMHNGTITAHNVKGQGTEFVIKLLVSPTLK